MLKVTNLEKRYSEGLLACKNISFDIKPGEFVAIIGKSGSGKTTLLKCLNQLIIPSSGNIFYKNVNITNLQSKKLREFQSQVAFIFQQHFLLLNKTSIQNVLLGSLARINILQSILGIFPQKEIEQATHFLEIVDLKDQIEKEVGKLSGGQQQRVAIARALMQLPKLILADEPNSSLDNMNSDQLLNYFYRINHELKVTIICNLHSIELAKKYSSRILGLKNGEIVFDGTPANLTDDILKNIYEK
jgi:phosphonate transport system ATP-binding protein